MFRYTQLTQPDHDWLTDFLLSAPSNLPTESLKRIEAILAKLQTAGIADADTQAYIKRNNNAAAFVPEVDACGYHIDTEGKTIWHVDGGNITIHRSRVYWYHVGFKSGGVMAQDMIKQLLNDPTTEYRGFSQEPDGSMTVMLNCKSFNSEE